MEKKGIQVVIIIDSPIVLNPKKLHFVSFFLQNKVKKKLNVISQAEVRGKKKNLTKRFEHFESSDMFDKEFQKRKKLTSGPE